MLRSFILKQETHQAQFNSRKLKYATPYPLLIFEPTETNKGHQAWTHGLNLPIDKYETVG